MKRRITDLLISPPTVETAKRGADAAIDLSRLTHSMTIATAERITADRSSDWRRRKPTPSEAVL
jgi:hypothetical protein